MTGGRQATRRAAPQAGSAIARTSTPLAGKRTRPAGRTAAAAVLLVLLLAVGTLSLHPAPQPAPAAAVATPAPAAPAHLDLPDARLMPGDLVFTRGGSLHSRAVDLAGPRPQRFTHVGLLDQAPDGSGWRVIHAAPSDPADNPAGHADPSADHPAGLAEHPRDPLAGVVASQSLASFVLDRGYHTVAVYRVAGLTEAQRDAALAYARQHLAAGTPFDGRFDLTTDDQLYCSELVYHAYRAAGLDLVGDRTHQVPWPWLHHPIILPDALILGDQTIPITTLLPRKETTPCPCSPVPPAAASPPCACLPPR